ncbi:hypothetical protein KDH_58330 [Dictyobacter sp. S3.2.2.5]|uniref:Uncharacterized protein n=1 Tax=Dictyobacter halimunensis TaxID=3026934 RepID=A0ABQ6FXJ4_9CHLR|nr:hypothetical protein KDH_58330 [Dictyobacter sp. S3.2.2.5]
MGTYLVAIFTFILVLVGAVFVHLWLGLRRESRYGHRYDRPLKPGLPQLDDIIFE